MIWTLEHGGLEGVGNQSITKAESCFSKNRVTVGQSESLCRMSMWPIAARTDCLIFARFKLRFNFHPNIEYSLRPSQVGPPRHREPELAGRFAFLAINVAARLAGRRPRRDVFRISRRGRRPTGGYRSECSGTPFRTEPFRTVRNGQWKAVPFDGYSGLVGSR